ncbi:hypothetical protein LCGC14_2519050 [marine sediment metagenome]|uniref:Uncharacterized protein n=1 Tax=marine sediment metagenome TaxID=412755 RepID=A0A0F9AXC3_9ZZZZ
MPGMFETPPTGRFDHWEPAIQSIPIPEGVSAFQDGLREMVKIHEKLMEGTLGVPAHLMESSTQCNFDYARLEARVVRQAEIDRRMDDMRRRYGRRPTR